MKLVKEHTLGVEEAKKRVDKFGEMLKQHKISFDWVNDTQARAKGKYLVVEFDAIVTVSDNNVTIEGKDPPFLFRSKAKSFLMEQMAECLK